LKIKKLELVGFKSFKDRTVIQFDDGITGIVGPNGCGKSNIVDALVWVMGEQSAKHLRGASMEDVIFAGAENYAPTGLAEVSLTLENDGGPFPAKYARHSEIMVTRRLHRSGDSEYLINKEPSRLRDIQEIFMDTGVGSKGFSIIEQGAIGKIITAKPTERRHLIEEAAGITKFKVRKRESEKKLAATDQNLLRLQDIIGEIKRQLDSLQRQAKKAEKYREIKNQVRDLDLWLSAHKYLEIHSDIEQVQKNLEEIQNVASQSQAQSSTLESQIQEARVLLTELEKKIHGQQSARFEAQSAVQKKEGEIQQIQFEMEQMRRSGQMAGNMIQELEIKKVALENDHQQAQTRYDSAEAEAVKARTSFDAQNEGLTQLRQNLTEADDQLIEKRRALVTVTQAQAHIQSQVNSLEQRLGDLQERKSKSESVFSELQSKQTDFEKNRRKNFEELEKERQTQMEILGDVENLTQNKIHLEGIVSEKRAAVEALKGDLSKVQSLHFSLQSLDANLEGFQEGVKGLISWQKERIAQGEAGEFVVLADILSVPSQYEVAMESVLGPRLQIILSQNTMSGLKGVELLKSQNWGRSSFLPKTEAKIKSSLVRPAAEEVTGFLSDIATVQDENYKEAVTALLSQVAVVQDLNEALSLRVKYPDWTFVTLEGEVFTFDGVMTGGARESTEGGLLRRRREIKELAQEMERAQTNLDVASIEQKDFEKKLSAVVLNLETAQKQKTEKEILIAEKKKDLERSENELQNLLQAIRRQQTEVEEFVSQIKVQEEKLVLIRGELNGLADQQSALEQAVEEISTSVSTYRRQVEDEMNVVTQLQVTSASKTQEAEGIQRQLVMMKQSLSDIEAQLSRMKDESTKSTESLSQNEIRMAQEKVQLEQMLFAVKDVADQLALRQNEYEELGAKVRSLDELLSEEEKKAHEAQNQTVELRLKLEQLNLRETNLGAQVLERYNAPMETIIAEQKDVIREMATVETELAELRDRLSKMGEVSLSAIQEYDELMTRYEFLTKQQTDLVDSKEQLRKVIDKIDRICSKQFRETFDAVNERFRKVFPVLFGGGEAHLLLVEQEDDSDPGIDIVSRPPGKKMQNITLLSGGEKALTSVALIFSIFLVKPSPFCLLDEVDAPLDDANVFRFNELVQEMSKRSQIIIVTHNKYTMEVNNKLYGVTMEERGVSKMVAVDLTSARRVAEVTA